jgi:hypothetical protein
MLLIFNAEIQFQLRKLFWEIYLLILGERKNPDNTNDRLLTW